MSDQPSDSTHTQKLVRLLDVGRTLSSTLDIDALLQEIVAVAIELTDSEAASILLYNTESQELRFEAAPGIHRDELINVKVPIETSAAGWIFTNNEPLLISDARYDDRIYREVDKLLRFETRSLLGVPLTVRQEPIGVLEAVNKANQGDYTEDDLVILEMLASQAAIAIGNAQLMGQLQEANLELKRLDRMKADFIAIASHELRTPLGLILGHATYLKETLSEANQEQMEVIIRGALRLKEIIEDMSAIAHEEQGKSVVRYRAFSLSRLIEDLAGRHNDEAKDKQISFGFDIPEDDALMVDGDPDKIDVALGNLVRNALTFTDPGGQVGIKAESDGRMVKVFVVDTGIGIPASDLDRVFDRFYQVESHLTRKHGGMGLGLSIAKAMIEMHGGEIYCESREGTGSLFWFTLPVLPEEHVPEAYKKKYYGPG